MIAAAKDEGFTEAPGGVGKSGSDQSHTDVASAFDKIDLDGDGSISREEMWSHFSRTNKGESLKKEDFDKLFDAIDTDKSGEIELDEYSAFVEQVRRMYASRKAVGRSSMKVSTLRQSLAEADGDWSESRRSSAGAIQQALAVKNADRRSSRRISAGSFRRSLTKGTRRSASGSLRGSLTRQRETRRATLDGADAPGQGFVSSKRDAVETDALGRVRFFDVEVREYGMTASDNPSVRVGVGLQMDWDFNILEREHLDTFEERRSKERAKNFVKEKKLTRRERERILRDYGATTEEIQEAAKRAAIVRNANKRSLATQDHDQLKEDFENVGRLLGKINPFRNKKGGSILAEALDVERLHPTLMAMLGELDPDNGDENETSQ